MRNPLRGCGGNGGGGLFTGRCFGITIACLSILSTLFFWLPSKTTTTSPSAVRKDHQAYSSSSSSSDFVDEEELDELLEEYDEIGGAITPPSAWDDDENDDDKALLMDHENGNEVNKEHDWVDDDLVYREEEILLEAFQDANNYEEEHDNVDTMTWTQILEKHAVCFNDIILQHDNDDGSTSRSFDCSNSTTLHFVPFDDDDSTPFTTTTSSPSSVSYDHVSNFVMKARYNCAPRTRKEWKLLLHPPVSNSNNNNNSAASSSCDLEQLIRDVGGPVGVGRQLLLAQQQQRRMDVDDTTVIVNNSDEDETTTNINDDDDDDTRHVYTVVFLGDSRLRQIWESLVGSYIDDITALKLLLHGQPHTAETEHHVYTQNDDLGDILYYTRENLTDIQEQGCHGTDFMHLFYPPQASDPKAKSDTDITMPTNLIGCSDDMSMVEFQHSIRFYFVQRPWSFETLNLAWDKLGLHHPDEQIDAYVTNVRHRPYPYIIHNNDDLMAAAASGYDEEQGQTPPPQVVYYPPNPPNENVDASSPFTKFFWDVPALHEASIRDLGFWDGATNAGIFDPPDAIHPCMPGLPDDQANLLLFLLLANVTHFSCGSSSDEDAASGGSDNDDDVEDDISN